MTLEDVGPKLRMPVQVVKSLEAEQWDRLGAPVFVRGQLKSYARLLNVDGEKLHLLPLGIGQRQQVVSNPPWAAVAVRLIRSL